MVDSADCDLLDAVGWVADLCKGFGAGAFHLQLVLGKSGCISKVRTLNAEQCSAGSLLIHCWHEP